MDPVVSVDWAVSVVEVSEMVDRESPFARARAGGSGVEASGFKTETDVGMIPSSNAPPC